MQRKTLLPAIFFIILCLSVFLLGKTAVGKNIESSIGGLLGGFADKEDAAQEAFTKALRVAVNQYQLEQENKALRDQFQTTAPSSQILLPAHIVGAPRFIPGVSMPEYFIIDKGKKDKIVAGQAVIFKDMLIGKIIAASERLSKAELISNASSTFTAKTKSTGALGVVRGLGSAEVILEKVVLSDTLTIGDVVLTKGDIDENGVGYPAYLVVGRIVSIDKKASALFQSARVRSIVDVSRLSLVFVFTGYGQ